MQTGITYAIGDVHGRSDLLKGAVAHVRDLGRADGRERRIKFTGDIVDRGPDSRGAMEIVSESLAEFPGSILHLGNHDEWFLDALHARSIRYVSDHWLSQGGLETLLSYDDSAYRALDVIREECPHHVELLRRASIITRDGPFTLVHAGVDPFSPLEDQDQDVNLWIRLGFLDHVGLLARPVVHGHTIMGVSPVVTENRISIDTGAYRTHYLTMLEIDHDQGTLRFLRSDPNRVTEIEPIREDRGLGTVLDRLPELFEAESLARTETLASPA